MQYIFADESWWLWSNESIGNSKYFVMTFLLLENNKDPKNIIDKVLSRAKAKGINRRWRTYFHANREPIEAVEKLLKLLNQKDIKIVVAYIDKEKISNKLSKDSHFLYNKITWDLLEVCERRWFLKSWDKIQFIASRRETNKALNKIFVSYVENSTSDLVDMDVAIKWSWEEHWLEVVDSVSYAIFRKYEFDNNWLYDLIKDKIVYEWEFYNENE